MKLNCVLAQLFTAVLLFQGAAKLDAQTIQPGVNLHIRVYLQGALTGVAGNELLMRDDLRKKGFLPSTEPYSKFSRYVHKGEGGNEVVSSPDVFQVTGPDAIVDWVFIELRSETDPKLVLATRSALLQRDGDVVDVDGVSPLHFKTVMPGQFYVAVRHRNHFGVMTKGLFELNEEPQIIDFTNPGFSPYGSLAQIDMNGVMTMWAGDFNQDGYVIYQGPFNDIYYLFSTVLGDPDNIMYNQNFISSGYLLCDANLDGEAVFTGPGNERTMIFFKVISPWKLLAMCDTCSPRQQLP